MPERIERLRAKLSELEEELRSIESLDSETRDLLESTVAELKAALSKEEAAQTEHQSLAERLREATGDFEDSHPSLFRIVGGLIDALRQLGI